MKTIKLTKWKATMNSRNFLVSIITLFTMIFSANGLDLNIDPAVVAETIASGNLTLILSLIAPLIFNIVTKLTQNAGEWSWGFLKSLNFWTQALTVVLVGVTAYVGINFETDAAGNVTAEIGNGIVPFAVAVLINIVNPIIHFFRKTETKIITIRPVPDAIAAQE